METQYNACFERPIVTKKDWLTRLSHGCLNKSVGEKIRRYSHLQALSARKLRTVILNPTLHSVASFNTALQFNENLGTRDDVKSPDPRLSPVILEDFTKPPRAIEETPPMLFTPEDFFVYLLSDKWNGKTCLRVLGGELLLLLLTALIHLEETRRINSHVMYANLNSRRPAAGQGSKDGKWIYEKMVVELIYYDKAVSSNIPYIIEEVADPMATPNLIPVPLDLKPEPYVHLKHPVNAVRFHPEENLNLRDKFARNERPSSVDGSDMISNKAAKPPLAAQQAALTETTDWIAENPFFGVPIPDEMAVRLPVPAPSELKHVKAIDSFVAETYYSPPIISPMIITSTSPKDIFSTDDISFNPSGDSYSLLNSAELNTVENQEPVLKSLNLSRNELYVTGLYDMRPENRVSTEEKLRKRKQSRDKKQIEMEVAVFESLQEKSKRDLTHSFKSLTTLKKKLISGPQKRILLSKTMVSSKQNLDAANWPRYRKEHEECEMESALKNVLQEGILARLKTLAARPKIEDPRFAQKGAKGKPPPHNKTHNSVVSNSSNVNFSHFGHNWRPADGLDDALNTYDIAYPGNQAIRPAKKNRSFNRTGVAHMDIDEEYARSFMAVLSEWRASLDRGVAMKIGGGQESKSFMMQNVFCVPPKSTPTPVCESAAGEMKCPRGILLRKKHFFLEARSKSEADKIQTRQDLSKLSPNEHGGIISERKVKFFNTSNLNINYNAKATASDSSQMFAKESKSSSQVAAAISRNDSIVIKSRNISINLSNFSEEESIDPTDHSESVISVHMEGDELKRSEAGPGIKAPSPTPVPVKSTVSEQLKSYNNDCTCDECVLQEPYLLPYKIQSNLATRYPLVLGRFRRNFPFLANKDYQPSKEIFNQQCVSAFNRMSESQVAEQLFTILNDFMIRKEILSSSLGHTYVTVTFTKPDVMDKMIRANSVLS